MCEGSHGTVYTRMYFIKDEEIIKWSWMFKQFFEGHPNGSHLIIKKERNLQDQNPMLNCLNNLMADVVF